MVGTREEFVDLMSKMQQTKAWKEMGMTNKKFAKVIGTTESTLYRWLRSESDVPLTVIYLLRLMLKDFKRD
ncbi:MAG: helix-turn-helix domain-containing protein [Fluviibacter sp.]